MAKSRIIRIGTAGWSIPRQYTERFPGAGPHLERYARVMNAAEINSSFHRSHKRPTYERWAASTPDDFRFAVKAPKEITHDSRLAGPAPALDRFAGEVGGLGKKLGAVLVQLPPNLKFDKAVAGRFFKMLATRIEAPAVCEPRHASWFTAQAEAWLKERRIARVAADPAPIPGASRPGGWRGLTYIRLHGSPRMYYSAYSAGFLGDVSSIVASETAPCWCIFDNTAASAALGDALAVLDSLRRPRRRGGRTKENARSM